MEAIQELVREHNGIKTALLILEKIVEKVDSEKNDGLKDTREIMEFLQVFVDKCHHGKEEDILFPEIVKAGIPDQGGPVGAMLNEHQQGRAYIGKMVEGLKAGPQGYNSFHDAAKSYIELLRAHIVKENEILYPLAEKKVPLNIWEQMPGKFEQIENERIGKGVHDKFHVMLTTLETQYIENNK